MQKMTEITGTTIPLARNDIDTDLIIPAQYLTSTSKKGYGENLFIRLRQNDPDFVFNQAKYAGASILITQDNFGCGSSREHAVWALQEAGIKAIIATSFADIFFGNSAKNGLLLITLSPEIIQSLLHQAQTGNYQLTINLEKQTITSSANDNYSAVVARSKATKQSIIFDINPFLRDCFMQGIDELEYLLSYQQEIKRHKE
jgi:3-isopropylmalate/(R)-2-methylmalate dehydratase small subunit